MSRVIKFRAWDKYEIGSDGSVWSTDFNNSGKRKQLKLYKDRNGYNVVWFTIKGKRAIHPVRKLVAYLFLGVRPDGLVINHKNGKRDDDRADNLEYVTQRENILHGWRVNGRKTSEKSLALMKERFSGEKNPKSKVTKEQVKQIRMLRETFKWSLAQIGRHYSLSRPQVSAICNNKFWV